MAGAQPDAKLYSIPGSHPAMAAQAMLELKGIPYKRVDLMPVISRGALKVLRFPSNTVPSLTIDGRKLTGLEGRSPGSSTGSGPTLRSTRPSPSRRVAVEDAERWGEEVLQPAIRRILWNALNETELRSRATRRARSSAFPSASP